MPASFRFGGGSCCCGLFCPNDACRNDPGARTVTVTISGVTNNVCTDCAGINGTWVFTLNPSPNCNGGLQTDFYPCGIGWKLFVSINKRFDNLKTYVYGGILPHVIGIVPTEIWQYEVGLAPQTCPPSGVLPMTLGSLSSQTACTFSGVTMTVEFS